MRLPKALMALLFLVLGLLSSFAQAFYDTEGNRVELSALKGKWAIIHYWAEWCQACVAEIPELNQFYRDNKDPSIVMYGVNYDALSLNELKQSIKNVGIEFPVLSHDPNDQWQLGAIDIVPVTFVVGPDGKVVKTIVGASDEQTLIKLFHELRGQ